jgi:hypothetical protein
MFGVHVRDGSSVEFLDLSFLGSGLWVNVDDDQGIMLVVGVTISNAGARVREQVAPAVGERGVGVTVFGAPPSRGGVFDPMLSFSVGYSHIVSLAAIRGCCKRRRPRRGNC